MRERTGGLRLLSISTAFALVFVSMAFPTSSWAATWRVEKDGSGDFTVIQDAVDAASPGDSLLVGAGRFEEFRLWSSPFTGLNRATILWIEKDGLTVIGAGRDLTRIGPAEFVERFSDWVTGSLYVEQGVSAEVRGLTLDNTHWLATVVGITRVEDCRLDRTAGSGNSLGMLVESTQGAFVSNCEFLGPGGILTGPARNLVIEDCVFDNPAYTRTAIVIGNGAQNCMIRRCVIRRAGVGVQFSFGGTGWVEDCVIESARFAGIDMSYGSAIVWRCRIGPSERSLAGAQGRLEVYDSILEGGTYATVYSTTTIVVRNSHILNVGGASVKGLVSAPNEFLDLRDNWWGTSDLSQIAFWIDDSYGTVTWQPILLGPVPTESTTIGELKASFRDD